jgi:hypothetical protein
VKNAFAVLFVLVAAACGDNNNNNKTPADSTTPPGDGSNTPGDGSNVQPAATLTSYVVDLVLNHTTTPEEARAYDEFKALPDPDGDTNNGSAYNSLFQ